MPKKAKCYAVYGRVMSLIGGCQISKWWRWRESNPRHSACKADALPTELHPLMNLDNFIYCVNFRVNRYLDKQFINLLFFIVN
jgi:hypothetical protein